MNELPTSATDLSLLEQMKDSRFRQDAWRSFVEKYARLIYSWFHEWEVDPFAMDDVLQDTMIRVLRDLQGFERRRHGSFRAWMKLLARNSWVQVVDDTRRQLVRRKVDASLCGNWIRIRSELAEDSLMNLFDAWATEELVKLAESRVRQRVDQPTWDTYSQIVLLQHSTNEATISLGIELNTLYSRLFRVRRMIREELRKLDGTVDTELAP